jgi:hypothetical protein
MEKLRAESRELRAALSPKPLALSYDVRLHHSVKKITKKLPQTLEIYRLNRHILVSSSKTVFKGLKKSFEGEAL